VAPVVLLDAGELGLVTSLSPSLRVGSCRPVLRYARNGKKWNIMFFAFAFTVDHNARTSAPGIG